ncbi:MAG: hypothetical protein OEL66_10440, partial [Desulfobulbaceae bacterium]|nr:hypothetical protein [Desulfobulbaceae bacterium]
MRKFHILSAFFILFVVFGVTGNAHAVPAKVYRLGYPLKHTPPPYKWLLAGLEKKGMVVGKNLQLVLIDLENHDDEQGREKIRQEIADKCDLFFVGGASLEILSKVEPLSPVLFINVAGPERLVPPSMKATTTGIRIGSESGIFQQAIEMLPQEQRQKLGLLFFEGSRMSFMASGFQQTCARLGFELVCKKYAARADIASVMQSFKDEGVGGVMFFPSGVRGKDKDELIAWQNKLKLPVLSIIKQDIEKGFFGGPTINDKVVKPSLAEYGAKILQGRSPSQLPVKYFSPTYVVNLATASLLQVNVPAEVVRQADIVGIATGTETEKSVAAPLVNGDFVVAIAEATAASGVKRFVKELAMRGYVKDENLQVKSFDLNVGDDPLKQRQLAHRLSTEADVIFANGSVLPAFASLPDLKTPVCFVATKETAAVIPASRKHLFTGVIRASFGSIIQSALQIIPGAKRIVMIGRPGSKLPHTIKRHQKSAAHYGVTLDYRLFADKAEIGPMMQDLQKNFDVMLLYSPGVDNEAIAEIIKWQNTLQFPVLAQFERHVRQGILAGMVVDMSKVSPKLAEYTDKLLQGRSPEQLPYYYYPGKFIINLRTASKLKLDIPAAVTSQAHIYR